MKKILDNPYLAPVMTPLKWIGASMAFVTGPYIKAAKETARDKSGDNPLLVYAGELADEVPPLLILPVLGGAVGGLIGGIGLAAHLLSGAALAVKIVGGLATVSAVTAASAVLAPFAVGAAIAAATLVAVTSVATVPGFCVGLKKTFDHVRRPRVPAVTAAPAPEREATTMEQLSAHLAGMSEDQRKEILSQLRNKASNDFGGKAPPSPELDKDIAVSKTIQLKKRKPT